MIKKFALFFVFLFAFLLNVNAKQIDINLFYSETCTHCHEEIKFLNETKKTNPNIVIHLYEINENENNILYKNIQELLDKPSLGVPYTVIGEYVLMGYSTSIKSDIEFLIKMFEKDEAINVIEEYKTNPNIKIESKNLDEKKETVLPIIGKINIKEASILLVAATIGFVDGFNPCAMWILLFLISMLVGMKDKKKMWILGLVFIITSALVYMIFMLAWLKTAIFATQVDFIRNAISIFALIFGIYNIYKFTKKPKDGCEVVSSKKRISIITKIKDLTSNKSFILSIIGMITLAMSVNIIELLCSLGLPFTFTNILAVNNVDGVNYLLYIFVYIFFFMLDDLIIFIIAMLTLKVTGVTTKYSRYSTLVGGIIMLIIGILMLFAPNLLMFKI